MDYKENKYFEYQKYDSYMFVKLLTDKLNLYETSILLVQLQRLLKQLQHPKAVISLEKVSMLDSSGIGMFISIHNTMIKNNSKLMIICSNGDMLKIFEISRMLSFLNIYPTLDEALTHL